MAETAPVRDVLYEAMEYLAKLGTNLRTRSENFKENKLRKKKLRNTHAVQKAANKVLLICELSKKSILNVEEGIKKILTHIDAEQGSTNFTGSTKDVSTDRIEYEWFEYDSKMLRIRNKINLSDYTSVKVFVNAMPLSMHDKYPVYNDCKLYQTRKKQSEMKQDENELVESDKINIDSVIEKTNSENVELSAVISEMCHENDNLDTQNYTGTVVTSDLEKNEKQKGVTAKSKQYKRIRVGNSNDSDDKDLKIDENIVGDCDNTITELINTNIKDTDGLEEETHITMQNTNVDSKSHVSEGCQEGKAENSDIYNKCGSVEKDRSEFLTFATETSLKSLPMDKVMILDTNHLEPIISKLNDPRTESCQERSSNKIDTEELNVIAPSNEVIDEIQSFSDDGSQCSRDSQPLIKCVNINKLLKTNIIPKKKESSNEILDSDTDKGTISKPKKKKFKSYKLSKKLRKESYYLKSSDDEPFWEIKRKEVKSFESKKFAIAVIRLPELTENFLYKYNLQRIIQNGEVICELGLQNVPVLEATKGAIENSKEPTKHAIKNALLQDSDSDCEKETANEIKAALLHESDTENSVKQSDTPELSKDKVIENIKSDKDEEDNDIPKNKQNCQTSTTGNNSGDTHESDSSPGIPHSRKRKKKLKDSSHPTKRKRIREHINAKKMLLNCSSSSEVEDEELNNTLKEVKVSLLQDESDEEYNSKQKQHSDDNASSSIKKSPTKDKNQLLASSNNDSDSLVHNNEVNSKISSEKMGRSKCKPDCSSSQSTDTQESYDKEIDGLTNLKSLTKKRRRRQRRRSPSTEDTHSCESKGEIKMPKVPLISEEGFLKAESSSDAASLADSDVGEEVEIPAISISGLNGDSVDYLAKDDLLEESNSDSHEKSSQDIKKEDESDKDNSKSKRRKANIISSDSEAGGSRKKDRDVRLSDFEDSDEDSEPTKKSKRKKKPHDSDASTTSSIDESNKKKRRRIKKVDDSEDASGSESETEGRNKHGRKNIRKVMGKNQLEEATKKAAREEKERIARITERQKLYNNMLFDESGKPDEVVLDKVVLDFDPETKEPLIEVDKGLVKKLKPHQANGIKFMWDACFESVKRIKKDKGSGCILAHCMGLGKTLQVVSLTHTLLTHGALTGVRRVLVVCPLSTVLNWVNEFRMWLKHSHADYDVDVYELSRHKQNSERMWQLQQWVSGGGVCVLGYEMFRNLSADNTKKFKKKMLKTFQESLVDPGPDLVVCDEGHLLKNEKTSLSQAMNRVQTLRRIVLTGTPLQNNLKEYYCMVQFVKPNLLGKYNEYLNRFVNPITNGQYTDSTEHDIRIMKRRSHVLHKMLDGAVQRRDYGVLAPFLPPKHEYVLFITLSEVQIKLYKHYLDNYSRRPLPGKSSGFLFPDFQSLQRIWTHPLVLKYNSERYEIMQQKKREREEEDSEGSLADFIDDASTTEESSTEESSDSLSDLSDDSRKKGKKSKSSSKIKVKDSKVATRRGTRSKPMESEPETAEVVVEEEEAPARAENPTEWWMSLVEDADLDDLRHSHKLVLLFDILRQCEAIGDKLLVFSQSLYSLDLIEHFLGKVDEATQEGRIDEKLNGHVGSWALGVDYFRLDGSSSCENRSIWCKKFNKEDNPRARLFLISTRAGGLGINLVAANRVVIFDVSWNPSHDVQSIFRVYRFGQKKPCYVYRFLAMGTMEEKIYERQVTKQAISKRVIDEQQIDRHYAENDLAELYKFEPRPLEPRATPPLPRDRLFAEMLREHEPQIYKYHEHDSLLENKEEETLTEEERKAAWEDFENEKTRPPPAPFSAYMHNGMMPGLLQQQQQLAYAAFAALLHKEMPNASDQQIREALYRSNPAMFGGYDYGFMQNIGELYKYAQPGMMNPAMLNSVMNAGTGMALGGTSGLQYEPPWQRQQQLLQQNQMGGGAKFYAGGLGSRDPVAMAMQQRGAREMMLGERTRPRGRPPRAPLAPHPAPALAAPTLAADIVNLDSD